MKGLASHIRLSQEGVHVLYETLFDWGGVVGFYEVDGIQMSGRHVGIRPRVMPLFHEGCIGKKLVKLHVAVHSLEMYLTETYVTSKGN